MNITTSYEIIDSTTKPGDARLVVYVRVNGDINDERECVYLSGPRTDIVDFVEGRADMAEIRRRWFSAFSDRAMDRLRANAQGPRGTR